MKRGIQWINMRSKVKKGTTIVTGINPKYRKDAIYFIKKNKMPLKLIKRKSGYSMVTSISLK